MENQTPNAELPEPAGVLSFTFGTKTETKLIANGEALFEGIPSNFNTERVHLQWNAQGFRKVDTSFLLNQEIMVLPVSRNDDLAEIYGIVMNEKGKPLKAVKIAIPCCYALTVATGEFALQIPFDHQKIEQRLDVFKVGYAPKSITTPVIPGEIVRLVLNKQ